MLTWLVASSSPKAPKWTAYGARVVYRLFGPMHVQKSRRRSAWVGDWWLEARSATRVAVAGPFHQKRSAQREAEGWERDGLPH